MFSLDAMASQTLTLYQRLRGAASAAAGKSSWAQASIMYLRAYVTADLADPNDVHHIGHPLSQQRRAPSRCAHASRSREHCMTSVRAVIRNALATLLLGASSLVAQPPASGEGVLSPGDIIRITVWRKPEMSGEFTIAPDGSIAHPLYQEVKISGLSLDSAIARVRAFLSREEANPAFILAPLLRVAIGGEVRQPNLYSLPPTTTIAQALALAGGPTERGRLDRVRVSRAGGVVILDLAQPSAEVSRLPIRSGDQILVLRRREFIRDIVAPASSIIGALAGIASIAIASRR
jgi:polysaccharide biosynthesis/export protein